VLWRLPDQCRGSVTKNNFRRLLLTFEALSDLGREMTAERDFAETARVMLSYLCDAVAAREGTLFTFHDRPAMLTSVASLGFTNFPDTAMVPLLPRQVHALSNARGPVVIAPASYDMYLTANGNVAPELFKCLAPLRVGGKLVGVAALGRRADEGAYDGDELQAIAMLSNYIALAVHNHALTKSLEVRIAENLRLIGSLHRFYDNTLEAFATAADVKDTSLHGHSLRVGRYAAGIGEAIGMENGEISAVKAAGYLHDIGMVAVDAQEFRDMADHTLIGHRIVSEVDFPWPKIPEVVRSHHERADGSGYPDHLSVADIPQYARIIAVADTFDAMTTERPYRHSLPVGVALSDIVRLTPQKYDPVPVQGLLVQVRRDATGSNKTPYLDPHIVCNIAPADIDQLASMLQHKLNNGRVYNC
jgi:putative nucleotidyltransferase with HDIG domain